MWAILLLYMVGVALVFAEFFIPGGMLGALGGLAIIASMVLGWVRLPEYGLLILGGESIGLILLVVLGLYLMSTTKLKNVLVLEARQEKSEGFASPSQDPGLIGALAEVNTALRPAGSITVNGKRIDAVSNGTFIDAGKTVRVIEVEGIRVVCELASPSGEETG